MNVKTSGPMKAPIEKAALKYADNLFTAMLSSTFSERCSFKISIMSGIEGAIKQAYDVP